MRQVNYNDPGGRNMDDLSFDVDVPSTIDKKIQISKMDIEYNQNGLPKNYRINIYFPELNLSKFIKRSEITI